MRTIDQVHTQATFLIEFWYTAISKDLYCAFACELSDECDAATNSFYNNNSKNTDTSRLLGAYCFQRFCIDTMYIEHLVLT